MVFDANAELARRTETSRLSLVPVLRVARYPGERMLDGEQQKLDASYSLTGERASLGLSASVARESTLTSELGTTGRTEVDANRESGFFAVAPQWLVTERLSAGANLGYQRVAYPGLDNTDLYGSRYATGSLNARYRLSPTMSMAVSGAAGSFDSQRAGAGSDSRGADGDLRLRHQRSGVAAVVGRSPPGLRRARAPIAASCMRAACRGSIHFPLLPCRHRARFRRAATAC